MKLNHLRHVNLDKIRAVFLKGKYFSKRTLETLKSDVAQAYAAPTNVNPSAAIDPNHVH